MATPSQNSQRVRFGEFELDLSTRELWTNGTKQTLAPQTFQVLQILIENRGQLVSHDVVVRHLWPSDTFVDYEQSLRKAVNRLREALKDSAEHPRFIENLPRQGYRFIATVNSSTNGEGILPVGSRSQSAVRVRNWPVIGVLLLVVGMAGLLLILERTRRNPPNWQMESVSALAGYQARPSFSPDGNSIVFDYQVEQGVDADNYYAYPDIYLKFIGDEKMLRLTNPPGGSFGAAWSPNGEAIAYTHWFEASPGRFTREIMLMTPLGGSKRILRRASAAGGLSWKVAWSPDGELLAYVDDKADEPSGVFLMSASGSSVRRLTTAPPNTADGYPSFSPDGRQIAFVRGRTVYKNDIYVVPVSGGEPRRLTFLDTGVFSPLWTPDGRKIIFSLGGLIANLNDISASDGSHWITGLYAVPVSGGRPERLPLPQMNVSDPELSRSGDKIAYQRHVVNMSIWKLPIQNASGSPIKFITSTSMDANPEFSPDGRQIVFTSLRDGRGAIWSCDADGGNLIRLVNLQLGGSPAWSPDSTRIAYDDRASGRSQIYLIGLRDHDTQQITNGDFESQTPAWSADGRSVYFASNRTGRLEIWKFVLSTRELVQITRNGGSFPQESPDGRFVYYTKNEAEGVWRVPTTGGAEVQVLAEADQNFRVRTDGVYFVGSDGIGSKRQPALKLFSLATGKPRVVGRLAKPATLAGRNLAISPDGRYALYAQHDVNTSEIILAKGRPW